MSDDGVSVGSRFTVVIPKAARERLGIQVGDRLALRVKGGELVMTPLPRDPFEVLQRVVGEDYDEGRDEAAAEEEMARLARDRH